MKLQCAISDQTSRFQWPVIRFAEERRKICISRIEFIQFAAPSSSSLSPSGSPNRSKFWFRMTKVDSQLWLLLGRAENRDSFRNLTTPGWGTRHSDLDHDFYRLKSIHIRASPSRVLASLPINSIQYLPTVSWLKTFDSGQNFGVKGLEVVS